ncbi:hypothetical protein EMWEY_00035560 [Eimeria maxima]|uniref:Transmembrane protein n=1 Tax=Eimeria maxima TaxID=5804 RepID=U6MEG9_EIMMA|nr:hypothetical protein EMWEY_00035560 [Eimeria maxima]CDJ60864.1 hypothetical protein EMWEY_00035560 [Eimeria maxima]
MDTSSVPHKGGDEFLEKGNAQANAAAVHSSAKLPRWRPRRNIRLATLLLLATLAATFVLLRCHRQLTVGRSPGEAHLRSLAEGEGAWGTTPCGGADVDGDETPDAAGNGIPPSMQQRVDAVMEKLEKVTKDLSCVACELPYPFTMKLLDLSAGFCIQEVAALSTLLGGEFDRRKVEMMETVLAEGRMVRNFSKDRDSLQQQTHTNRVMNAARHIIRGTPVHPTLTRSLRLEMLEELLHLQELAISLIDAVVSRVLRSNPEGELSLELTNEVMEEVRRIVYLRRAQVFMSSHLSHQLRAIETTNRRGLLVQVKRIAKIDARPKLTLDEKVAELIQVGEWKKKTVDETRQEMVEAIAKGGKPMDRAPRTSGSAASERQARTPLLRSSPPTLQSDGTSQNWRGSPQSGLSGEMEGYLPRHHESQVTQSAATDVLSASKTHFSGKRPSSKFSPPRFLPPRFQRQSSFKGVTSMKEISTGGFGNTEASLAPETLPATGEFSHMYTGESQLKSYAQPYQATTVTYRPGQSLPELGTAPSEPGVSLNISWDEHASSGPASTSSLGTRLQRTVAGADVPLEAPRQGWDAARQSGVATTPSWSPWSSNWPTLLPITPQRQTPDPHMTLNRSQGDTSQQTSKQVDRLPWVFAFFPVPSPSSGPFTTPQATASAGAAMLYSGQPQERSAVVQSMTPPPSRPHLPKQPSSISPASSLMMEQGVHSGVPGSSVQTMMSPRYFHSVGRGIPRREVRSLGQLGAPSAESQVSRAFRQERDEGSLGESEWLDDDSDSG